MSKTEFRVRAWKAMAMLCAGVLMLGAVASSAADLPPLPAGLSAPTKATQTPAFNLQTAAGGMLRADDLRGKVVIARFWASW